MKKNKSILGLDEEWLDEQLSHTRQKEYACDNSIDMIETAQVELEYCVQLLKRRKFTGIPHLQAAVHVLEPALGLLERLKEELDANDKKLQEKLMEKIK